MDFKLDIGELTNTIRNYENFIKILAEQKENINKAIKELTDLGWSGAAKDKFLENHAKKQEFYTKLEEDIKYMKSALENEEKPRAVRLKKICEGFEGCIKRSGGGAALTSDDIGLISLQYSGQALINRNVDECVNNHYKRMDSKFVEILNLVNSLTFTSFPIGGDIEKAQKSLKDQTTSLTDFNDSFNEYCRGVKTMESNICSIFGKISGITEGISKFRGVSDISEGGQVDKNKVMQLMLKNSSGLTNEEKELLSYVEKALGEKNYTRLKEAIINGDKNQEIEAIVNSNRDLFISTGDGSAASNNSNIAKATKEDNDPSFWKPVWDFEDGVNNFLAQHFNNPVGEFMSRISITGGNVATFGNGSKEIADTGSPTANKIADIIGTCGGFVFNPEAGLEGAMGMAKGIKGVQGFLARKIENVGNKVAEYNFENMGQYIRSVLYGQPQIALPNGMGIINTTEDLFKFSKIEGDLTKGAAEAERLISGTPGVVTGGDSTKLGKNIMESMGLKRSTKWTGHQAQHIIPAEMADSPIIQKIGMNLDDATNGILLRTPDADLSAMSRHRGYHSVYNDVVRNELSKLDINQSVDVLQKQVFDLQSNLRKLQESGLPLYPGQGATVNLWERSLNRITK